MKVLVDLSQTEIELPDNLRCDTNSREFKEWLWQHHRDELLSSLNCNPSPCEDDVCRSNVEESLSDRNLRRLELLDTITRIQRLYFQMEEPQVVFDNLLDGVLSLMGSEYGFIGKVEYEDDGTICLQHQAITNIAWDSATREFFDKNKATGGLKFYNMNSLYGAVITTQESVIANNPANHHSAGGLPEGHPPLNNFLGIPFFDQAAKRLVGVLGLANKPGGYKHDDISFLDPVIGTCSNLITCYNATRANAHLISTLEDAVVERTLELQLANKHLAEANRSVLSASAAQLKHFACMSHEIRTPLNCIIGVSSVLRVTNLDDMQRDSVEMIINSGELLSSVVNDVLDFSKLASGNVIIDKARTSLQETLDGVVQAIDIKASEKKLDFQIRYGAGVPEYIETDGRRLQQILFNLLGNAIKFSREGSVVEFNVDVDVEDECSIQDFNVKDRFELSGTCQVDDDQVPDVVEVTDLGSDSSCSTVDNLELKPSRCPFSREGGRPSTCPAAAEEAESKRRRCPFSRESARRSMSSSPERQTRRNIRIASLRGLSFGEESNRKAKLIFTVKDHGKGIKKSDFAKIFEPFQQTSETERFHGGTGLGLAITSRLVDALGGAISVDSEYKKWSTFRVELPLNEIYSPRSRERCNAHLLWVKTDKCARMNKALIGMHGVEVTEFSSFDQIEEWLATKCLRGNQCTYFFLVQENLFHSDLYRRFATTIPSALLTYGPNYCVPTSFKHFRSLQRLIPAVFIQTIFSFLEGGSGEKRCQNLKSEDSPNSQMRILVAEDNTVNQKVLRRILACVGVDKIDIADDGEKAVDAAARKDYDIIFMDMQMPRMDGLEACRNIVRNSQGKAHKPKVIFVTAHVSSNYEKDAREAGGVGFIPKPFNLRDIENFFEQLKAETIQRAGKLPKSGNRD